MSTLAYVFWHWPARDADRGAYEDGMRAFHEALALPGSVTYALDRAPFEHPEPYAYEDWYPVASWDALSHLNERALSGPRRAPHDAVAQRAADGAGGVYAELQAGTAGAPARATWLAKPPGMPYDTFIAELRAAAPAAAIWQRQMVLGPAPEFVLRTPTPPDLPWPATRVALRAL